MDGSFGTTLRALREGHELTRVELARRAGINVSTISRLESGGREPSRSMVENLAMTMDLDDDERAKLLESAGFLSGGSIDPVFWDLNALLNDPRCPEQVARNIRELMGSMTRTLGGMVGATP